jgi:hypothetical protein
MIDELTPFIRHVKQALPGASTTITPFASGGLLLDVRVGERSFVMAYSPTNGFGVDEIMGGEGFESGYKYHSSDFTGAAELLLRLLTARQAA